jgi:hypothetical protein
MRLPSIRWMFTLRAGLVWLTIANIAAVGGTLHYWKRQRDKMARLGTPYKGPLTLLALTKGMVNTETKGVSEGRLPIMVGPKLTYNQVEDFSRAVHRSALDIDWSEWKIPDVKYKKHTSAVKFDPEIMPAPDKAEIERIKAATPIVRSLPYPYFTAFAVPSDGCGSTCSDPYYMHSLVSRKYGLDLPGSFFPYTSSDPVTGPWFALFAGQSSEPSRFPTQVEGEPIDVLPLLLTCFHRGWFDHIHDWSAGVSSPLPLTDVAKATVSNDGSAIAEIRGLKRYLASWSSLELRLDVLNKVTGFEIELTDRNGVQHWVVYKRDLSGRSGWDLSDLNPSQLRRCYVDLRMESNPPPQSAFGKQQTGPIQSGRLVVFGETGSSVELKSIVAMDITRDMVLTQVKAMKRFNLLPAVSTWHGGANSWVAFLFNSNYEVNDAVTGTKIQIERPAMGQDPKARTYVGDAVRELGITFFSDTQTVKDNWSPSPSVANALQLMKFDDGLSYYHTRRNDFADSKSRGFPGLTDSKEHAENLGTQFASALSATNHYGDSRILYTHFNYYNGKSFDPPRDSALNLHQIKQLEPFSEEMFGVLSNLMYNLDGKRKDHQRVWVTPVSALLRFAQAQRQLAKHTVLEKNTIKITPWIDEVTNKTFPESAFVSQDLHGQTFYVQDAKTARVFVGEQEIRALQRNAADFTGRPSVTIVDTHCPTVICDELDLLETNGRLQPLGASHYFQQREAYTGNYAAEVQLAKDGKGMICWKPFVLNNHETTHLRFAFKKTNPESRVILAWSQSGEAPQFMATDGDLGGIQGWELPLHTDSEYHEMVLDFASMQAPAKGKKAIPRGAIRNVFLGLVGKAGDSVFFDKVEFLSSRGVRPHAGNGLVVGGRIHPPCDGEKVRMKIGEKTLEAETDRGGWYFFPGVPVGAIAKITYERAGITYFPARGRLAQIEKNDVEYHLFALDPRSPSVPRPDFGDQKVPPELVVQLHGTENRLYANWYEPHSRRFYAGNVGSPMAYIVEDWLNNRGWYDRDRRPANPDGAIRLFLHGTCLEEGAQTPLRDHLNVLLESILRRRTGVNVEVAAASHSNSSIAANSHLYEAYGKLMKPDFVILMNDPVNMWHLEPTLLEKQIGWTKGHTPYRGFDFDNNGQLVEFPPDPEFPAFMKKADPKPLVDDLPLSKTYFLLSEYPPLVERSFQLFQAIAKTRYTDDLKKHGGRLIVASGYHGNDYPTRGKLEGKGAHALSTQKYLSEMQRVTENAGGIFVDLSKHTLKYDYAEVMSFGSADGHLSSSGHYIIANALADRLLQLPEFQAVVEQRKKETSLSRR